MGGMAVSERGPDAGKLDGASSSGVDGARCLACGDALGAPLLASHDRGYGLPGTFSIAICRTCGLGVTLPAIDAAQLPSFYPATYGAYDRLPSGLLGLISRTTHRLLAWQALHTAPLRRLASAPAGRLLDVGCGRGDLGSWFVRRGWSVVGVEPSAQACTVARQRGVDARAGTLEEVALEPNAYDVTVFRHSLEHVLDPVADLRRAREALRDGGMAIVTVPNFGCWQRRRFGSRWLHLDLPRHRLHFDAGSLRATLTRAGFTRVEMCTASSAVGLPASIQYAIAGRCLFPSGLKLRVAIAVCSLTTPVSWLTNRLAGGNDELRRGDVLHAIAFTQRDSMRFAEVGPEYADALAQLFERNSDPTTTRVFDPFALTAEQARGIAIEPSRDLYYVLVHGERLLALSMLRGFDEGYEVPSFGVLVDRESRGGGMGRRLAEWTIEQATLRGCEAVRLTVYADNPAARNLFVSLGFRELERQMVDRDGEPAEKIVMRLDLGS